MSILGILPKGLLLNEFGLNLSKKQTINDRLSHLPRKQLETLASNLCLHVSSQLTVFTAGEDLALIKYTESLSGGDEWENEICSDDGSEVEILQDSSESSSSSSEEEEDSEEEDDEEKDSSPSANECSSSSFDYLNNLPWLQKAKTIIASEPFLEEKTKSIEEECGGDEHIEAEEDSANGDEADVEETNDSLDETASDQVDVNGDEDDDDADHLSVEDFETSELIDDELLERLEAITDETVIPEKTLIRRNISFLKTPLSRIDSIGA